MKTVGTKHVQDTQTGNYFIPKDSYPYSVKLASPHEHSQGYEYLDVKTFISWGVDLLKLDGCNFPVEQMQWKYTEWSRLLNASSHQPILAAGPYFLLYISILHFILLGNNIWSFFKTALVGLLFSPTCQFHGHTSLQYATYGENLMMCRMNGIPFSR